jgi:hypothetical protein
MKKLIALSVAFALVATAAFADIRFSLTGRGTVTLLESVGGDAVTAKDIAAATATEKAALDAAKTTHETTFTAATNAALVVAQKNYDKAVANFEQIPVAGTKAGIYGIGTGNAPRARLNVAGDNADKTLGFEVRFQTDGGTPAFGNQANIWAQPFKALQVKFGKYEVDTLRGKVELDTEFAPFVGGTAFVAKPLGPHYLNNSADAIFSRFSYGDAYHGGGFTTDTGADALRNVLFTITPIENLVIGVNLRNFDGSAKNDEGELSAVDQYRNFHIAAGYTIPNIGQARFGILGGARESYSIVEAAFAYTGVKDLLLDLGAKFAVGGSDKGVKAETYAPKFALGAKYTLDKLTVPAILNFETGADKSANKGDAVINLYTEPVYNLGDYSVGGAVKFATTKDINEFGIGAFGQKNLTGGWVRLGIGFNTLKADTKTFNKLYIPLTVNFAI